MPLVATIGAAKIILVIKQVSKPLSPSVDGSSGLTYGSSSHLSCLDSHYPHRNATASGHIGRSDI